MLNIFSSADWPVRLAIHVILCEVSINFCPFIKKILICKRFLCILNTSPLLDSKGVCG